MWSPLKMKESLVCLSPIQMRSSVASSWFLFRKKVDNLLNALLPKLIIPKYEMVIIFLHCSVSAAQIGSCWQAWRDVDLTAIVQVAFTRIPYHECIERAERQNKVRSWSYIEHACDGVMWCLNCTDTSTLEIHQMFFWPPTSYAPDVDGTVVGDTGILRIVYETSVSFRPLSHKNFFLPGHFRILYSQFLILIVFDAWRSYPNSLDNSN